MEKWSSIYYFSNKVTETIRYDMIFTLCTVKPEGKNIQQYKNIYDYMVSNQTVDTFCFSSSSLLPHPAKFNHTTFALHQPLKI